MKKIIWFSLLFFILSFDIHNIPLGAEEQSINSVPIKGYFVSNKAVLASSTEFLIIKGQNEFDKIFLRNPPPFDQAKITKVDFQTRFVIAVIKESNNYWKMKVNRILFQDEILKIDYTANKVVKNMRWTAAIPLIVMIKNISYTKVQFFENGKLIKEMNNLTTQSSGLYPPPNGVGSSR